MNRLIPFITLCVVVLGGCRSGYNNSDSRGHNAYIPPDGTRLEYPSSEYRITDYGEAQYRQPPRNQTVWRTRPGPETGPHSHDPLSEFYLGYERKDSAVLAREMGLAPASGQYSRAQPQGTSGRKKKKTKKSAACSAGQGEQPGFNDPSLPPWARSYYGNLTDNERRVLENEYVRRQKKRIREMRKD